MPCNCDHLEPTQYEVESNEICKHLVYILPLVNKNIPGWIQRGADDFYGDPLRVEELTIRLCSICKDLTKKQKQDIVYDGRIKEARNLANWLEEHEEIDREREKEEKRKQKRKKLKKIALSKLTKQEKKALDYEY